MRRLPPSISSNGYGRSVVTRCTRSSPLIDGARRISATTSSTPRWDSTVIIPRIAPWLRMCRVSARVSTPWIAVIRVRSKYAASDISACALDGSSHDKARHLRLFALLHHLLDAVVADVRIGHHHDLEPVRRIGGDLLVSGERGVEDDFADGVRCRAEAPPVVDSAVFQYQAGRGHARGL